MLGRNQHDPIGDDEFLKKFIKPLFDNGLTNKQIVSHLKNVEKINLSLSSLKVRLSKWGWYRSRKNEPNKELVKAVIQHEIDNVNRDAGYRRMKTILLQKHKMHVKQSAVVDIMREIDPEGVHLRKKGKLKRRVYYPAGPDETWSYDGHDELVKFGLAINGAVDVWSGKFIWLKVFMGNHDPKLIAKYFVESIAPLGRFPYSIRSDCGTETVIVSDIIQAMHTFLGSGVESKDSVRFVPSTRNQKIESAWSRYLRAIGKTIQDTIQEGFERRIYNDKDELENYIFLFVWMPLVQNELDDYRRQVNNHNRQGSRSNSKLPKVAPNICYDNPWEYGAENCGIPIDDDVVAQLIQNYCLERIQSEYLPERVKIACEKGMALMDNPTVSLSNAWEIFEKLLQIILVLGSE